MSRPDDESETLLITAPTVHAGPAWNLDVTTVAEMMEEPGAVNTTRRCSIYPNFIARCWGSPVEVEDVVEQGAVPWMLENISMWYQLECSAGSVLLYLNANYLSKVPAADQEEYNDLL
ncbi:hypothetical protein J3E69DRAFT_78510 [Trichoderma sp. SZMC 28015]